jgi:hypothetical protein
LTLSEDNILTIENNLATNISFAFFLGVETPGNIKAYKEFRVEHVKNHNGAPYFTDSIPNL